MAKQCIFVSRRGVRCPNMPKRGQGFGGFCGLHLPPTTEGSKSKVQRAASWLADKAAGAAVGLALKELVTWIVTHHPHLFHFGPPSTGGPDGYHPDAWSEEPESFDGPDRVHSAS